LRSRWRGLDLAAGLFGLLELARFHGEPPSKHGIRNELRKRTAALLGSEALRARSTRANPCLGGPAYASSPVSPAARRPRAEAGRCDLRGLRAPGEAGVSEGRAARDRREAQPAFGTVLGNPHGEHILLGNSVCGTAKRLSNSARRPSAGVMPGR
jgi:hypothetical protein